jgi:L-threonylcarbamoyladenylate synthase
MIIDGGVCKVGIESTVIDLTTKPKILREGGLSSEVIEKFLKMKLFENKNKIIKSPGQIGLHYSPGMPIYMNREKATKMEH